MISFRHFFSKLFLFISSFPNDFFLSVRFIFKVVLIVKIHYANNCFKIAPKFQPTVTFGANVFLSIPKLQLLLCLHTGFCYNSPNIFLARGLITFHVWPPYRSRIFFYSIEFDYNKAEGTQYFLVITNYSQYSKTS